MAPDGAMGYTLPHSVYKPEGSIVSGWRREISIAGGAPVVLSLEVGNSTRRWVACPAEKNIYQVYVKITDDHPFENCVPFRSEEHT